MTGTTLGCVALAERWVKEGVHSLGIYGIWEGKSLTTRWSLAARMVSSLVISGRLKYFAVETMILSCSSGMSRREIIFWRAGESRGMIAKFSLSCIFLNKFLKIKWDPFFVGNAQSLGNGNRRNKYNRFTMFTFCKDFRCLCANPRAVGEPPDKRVSVGDKVHGGYISVLS